MENEIYNYSFGELELKLPRKWVKLDELEDLAGELGFELVDDLVDILGESDVEIKDDMADFNQVYFFLMKRGIAPLDFLIDVINAHYQNERYTPFSDLINFLAALENTDGEFS